MPNQKRELITQTAFGLFDVETVFSRVVARVNPSAIGRGEIVGVVFQNPLLLADGTSNSAVAWVGSATNVIHLLLPGERSELILAEDMKDIYTKVNFPEENPNGAVLTLSVNTGGTGYAIANVLTLVKPGVFGSDRATATVATLNTGITAATLNAGGAGYAVNDNVTVNGGTTLAHIIIDTVDGGGAVLTFHVVSPGGNGYAVAAGVATTYGGVGVGFTVNITQVRNSVLTVTLVNPGLGYEVGDLIEATGGAGTGVILTILTVETVDPETCDLTAIIYKRRGGAKQ